MVQYIRKIKYPRTSHRCLQQFLQYPTQPHPLFMRKQFPFRGRKTRALDVYYVQVQVERYICCIVLAAQNMRNMLLRQLNESVYRDIFR